METKIECEVCKSLFTRKCKHHRQCSDECRNLFRTHAKHAAGKPIYDIGTPPGTIGAIAELAAANQFMMRGFTVFRALSPSAFCDLVATKGDVTFYIEVRTAYQDAHNGKFDFDRTLRGRANLFAVFNRANGQIITIAPNGDILDMLK